jgi:hypothetical protein
MQLNPARRVVGGVERRQELRRGVACNLDIKRTSKTFFGERQE